MYARSTTFNALPASIDAGTAHIRDEVQPALLAMDGCRGLSLIVDRGSGRCIATSSWESEDAMHATADRVGPIRDRAIEIFGGTSQVEEWEIAVMHRNHNSGEGACVRAVWMRVEPTEVDRAIDVYKLASLPEMEGLDGFCSASLLVDRASGRAVSSVTYDSLEAMEGNRDQASRVRSTGTQEAKAEVLAVCEFELALAHLHVPEMA